MIVQSIVPFNRHICEQSNTIHSVIWSMKKPSTNRRWMILVLVISFSSLFCVQSKKKEKEKEENKKEINSFILFILQFVLILFVLLLVHTISFLFALSSMMLYILCASTPIKVSSLLKGRVSIFWKRSIISSKAKKKKKKKGGGSARFFF